MNDKRTEGRVTRSFSAPGSEERTIGLLPPTTEIGKRYEIRRVLGMGGYGVVYLAFDRRLEREIALKVLRPEKASGRVISRFHREVKIARDASHPRLLHIFDVGIDDEIVYITMEFVEGNTLRQRLEGGPLPIDEVVAIASQILEGLDALHSLGIIHRDVKPANVLLDQSRAVKLADFGLARYLTATGSEATTTGALIGTADYLSPEQALGRPVAERSDLYSFGVVLYEMLTGQLPFPAQTSVGAVLARLKSPPPDPRGSRPDTPRWLSKLVLRLLARHPGDRYPSAAAVLHDLRGRRASLSIRRRTWIAIAVVTLALSAVTAFLPWIPPESSPEFSHLAVRNDHVYAIGSMGERMWELDGDPETIHLAGLARLAPDSEPLLATFLFRRSSWSPESARTLYFLDPATGDVVRDSALPEASDAFPDHSLRYQPDSMKVVDLDGDGADEILVTYIHMPESPSYTVLYEPRYERARILFIGSGHHRAAGIHDLDGDGRSEVVLVGINNALGWYNAVTAIRVVPWIGHDLGSRLLQARSPDLAPAIGPSDLVQWYALLPRGVLPADVSTRFDDRSRTLALDLQSARTIHLTFSGFDHANAGIDEAMRERGRREAWRHLYESRRVLLLGQILEALEEARAAAEVADEAMLPRLAEAARRQEGKALVAAGRIDEAERNFTTLVAESENAPEVAFDAAEALHLRGELKRAVAWYERGLGPGASFGWGKSKHEFLQGIVFALVEQDEIEAARDAVQRYFRAYAQPPDALDRIYEEFVRWSGGEDPRIEGLEVPPLSVDLFRYWMLEFAFTRGENPSTLLPRVDAELAISSQLRACLWSLKGELFQAMGREAEAGEAARRGFELIREQRRWSTVARAHAALVTERFERLQD